MERNIRDVRDIFGRNPRNGDSKQDQELRSYDCSPRSRRRHEAMESYDHRAPTSAPNHHTPPDTSRPKKSTRHRTEDAMAEPPARQGGKKSSEDPQKAISKSTKDAAYYANRTLTERDIRHLERHLSMKKTIRKQISRNLHQAFVDDPDSVLNDATLIPVAPKTTSSKVDRTFTLTRAKVSKSEQNVLDLLKDNEPDSGHCSADNPNSSDDDTHHEKMMRQRTTKSVERSPSPPSHKNSRPVYADNRNNNKADNDAKFSFWKMFSVKNRGKR